MTEHATSQVAFMTANFVARQTGYAMDGWGHGDRATNEWFSPLGTYRERLDEMLAEVAELGFDTIDVWGAHLSPEWATDKHVDAFRDAVAEHGLAIATYATWIGPSNVARACELARTIGTDVIGAGISGDPASLAPVLRKHGVRIGIENHPEKTPGEVLAAIEEGQGTLGATIDTGWWATQGYDPVRAIEELREHLLHVHLKDVLPGPEHVTCRWGEGAVDVEACVRTLRGLGYTGTLTVEHEPEHEDPREACREMLGELRGWLV